MAEPIWNVTEGMLIFTIFLFLSKLQGAICYVDIKTWNNYDNVTDICIPNIWVD